MRYRATPLWFFFFLDFSFTENGSYHISTATRLDASAAKCLGFPALNPTVHINSSSAAVVLLVVIATLSAQSIEFHCIF